MNKTGLFTVFTLKVAGALCEQGFRCIQTEPDKKKPWLHVYKFKDTPELRAAIAKMKKE